MSIAYEQAAIRLDYDCETGQFSWTKSSMSPHGSNGKPAGCKFADGYVYIRYLGKPLLAHRIAWLKAYGELPNGQLDHVNMNRSDNRISNLRVASFSENNRNKAIQSNNTSGHKGVCFHKGTNKFHAKITVNKKTISLGYFKTLEEAASEYQQAVKEHHGEFARPQ